ncbi:hypothetical protein PENSTE_c011G00031 [Penicillium steckii]|uniref:Uncharacterized protein n=1 Tax=Penicillium steckii TaxID=303698 RepID=A0A1V6T630_9EURO|nr:hypothetical protein PENSTE_c011G00031 [Penicillium steckii]
MIAELAADYTNNGKWVELYKLFASSGQVIDAVDTVIQYTLLDQIDHEVFKEVWNFYIIDVIWRHSEMGLKSSDSKDALRVLEDSVQRSPNLGDSDLETLMLPAITWAKQKLSEAVSLLDAHARDLIRVTLPQSCLFFLPFTGRRRFWIQSLEREVIFVSALEHSPRDIRILQSELVENPTWKCVAACWEEFLFYRIDRDWLDIQTFTGILEQTHLAYLSGRGTMSVFGRTLMRKINCILSRHSYHGHPLIATKMALFAFEKIFRAAPNIRNKSAKLEMRSALSDFIRASDLARNIVMWNIYPVLNVIEVGITAFLWALLQNQHLEMFKKLRLYVPLRR